MSMIYARQNKSVITIIKTMRFKRFNSHRATVCYFKSAPNKRSNRPLYLECRPDMANVEVLW